MCLVLSHSLHILNNRISKAIKRHFVFIMLFCLILAWRDEAEGTSRSGGVLKAILNVEQGDGHRGAVILGELLSLCCSVWRGTKVFYNSMVQPKGPGPSRRPQQP